MKYKLEFLEIESETNNYIIFNIMVQCKYWWDKRIHCKPYKCFYNKQFESIRFSENGNYVYDKYLYLPDTIKAILDLRPDKVYYTTPVIN